MIASVTYTLPGSAVSITMEDGSTWFDDAALPDDTEMRRALAAWLAAGNAITPYALSIDIRRSEKIGAIEAKAATLLSAGAPVAADQHIALDDGSRADLTAMATTATAASAGAVSWPDSYARGWITIENVRIPLATPAAGLMLAASAGNYYAAIIQHRRDLKDAALAAGTSAALDAIDINAGWPA